MSKKGVPQSEEHKKRIGDAQRGVPRPYVSFLKKGTTHTDETKQKISRAGLGRKASNETKKRMSDAQIKIGNKPPQFFGEKSSAFVGTYYWLKQAKIRDDYTCQICGLKDVEIIEIDHIIPKSVRPDLKFELSNLMCLCPNCHRRKTNREKKAKVYKLGIRLT